MLYEKDILLWSEQQAKLLLEKKFDQLDLENIAEEILDLGKRERDRFMSSWEIKIKRERNHLRNYLEDTPSLVKYSENLDKMYKRARGYAANETGLLDWDFPDSCPYTKEQIEADWWPL